MSQPLSFHDPNFSNHVCKLKKASYVLKQAPRAWFDKFNTFLLEFGFMCSKVDLSIFVYPHEGKTLVILLYVDDIILIESCSDLLKTLMSRLSDQFSMKDLGQLHYFLGV